MHKYAIQFNHETNCYVITNALKTKICSIEYRTKIEAERELKRLKNNVIE